MEEVRTRQPETLGREQRSDLLDGEPRERPLDDLHDGQLLGVGHLGDATELVEELNREPGGSPVLLRDPLDGGDGLVLAAAGHEELGRLVEGEEEAGQEHAEGDGAQGQDEVAPAPVVSLEADLGGVLAREVGDKGPRKHTGTVLAGVALRDAFETYLAIRVPTDHQVASPLRMLPELGGRHSQKTAASTGKLPPTPSPMHAYKAQVLGSWLARRTL